MIYFIQQGTDGPIKIGYTSGSVERRISTLQTASPEKLHLIAKGNGTKVNESMLHQMFSDERLNGEWFKPSERLIEYIHNPFLAISFDPPEPIDFSELPVDLNTILDEITKKYMVMALKKSGGIGCRAAQLLGISFRSFRYRLEKHGIN